MTPEAREAALSRIPLKRFGNVDEIADAAVFLATNAYANNCVLNLDGGLSATVCEDPMIIRRTFESMLMICSETRSDG